MLILLAKPTSFFSWSLLLPSLSSLHSPPPFVSALVTLWCRPKGSKAMESSTKQLLLSPHWLCPELLRSLTSYNLWHLGIGTSHTLITSSLPHQHHYSILHTASSPPPPLINFSFLPFISLQPAVEALHSLSHFSLAVSLSLLLHQPPTMAPPPRLSL